ncbi:guanine nucleotide exchange factor SPIKE 1-like isoform X5 [Camellia sinensis]|uniref:guanine nucleotide exchange factor SPIKE 1-like isoform X5 n=1 Tax=Camellia sinensis TaxID=4442 RepID=UPI001036DA6E|nr:guanine nucleotide exchange factor SPIKE 1-like isoform X5 [Camellia sinensis]
MHLANARQTKIDDTTDDDIPSTSGRQFTDATFSDSSHSKVSKHLGESPLPAYEPVFDWENERSMIFGQQIPETHKALYGSGLKISLKVLSLAFRAGLVASVCLLIQLEKPATEKAGVTPSVYSLKEQVHLTKREKQKLQVVSNHAL